MTDLAEQNDLLRAAIAAMDNGARDPGRPDYRLTRQSLVWAVEDHEEVGYCSCEGECYAVQSARRILGSLPNGGRQ